jgi:hypothetical protein
MTAQRWWVRSAARWLARVGGVQQHLRLALLGMTGLSTATLTLRQYGHGEWAWPLIAATASAVVVYTYAYTEGGVWNQVSRDRMDMSKNYADPRIAIDDTAIGAAAFVAVNGRAPTDEELTEIQKGVHKAVRMNRDGVDLEDLEA